MAMSHIHVTDAEGEILAALWRRGPLTPLGLIEEVRLAQPWGDATIKTLLGRLMRKKAIRSDRDGGRLTYVALVERETYVDGQVDALVDRLFDGDRQALAAHLKAR